VKTGIYHCNVESMRREVDCYCDDVVNTYKILSLHWPSFSVDSFKNRQQPLFLIPMKVKKGDSVWFLKKAVGKNALGATMRTVVEAAGIDKRGRIITNKTMRRIGISQMEEAGVLVEKGMRITGHRDAKSYAKYRANDSEVDDRVCQDLIYGVTSLAKGKAVQFEQLLLEEKEKLRQIKVSFTLFCSWGFFSISVSMHNLFWIL
jgi:hypothetical protein